MAELPIGIVTFLFTDIEGSTRLLQEIGDSFPALLETHDQLVREAIAETGGVEVSTEGESFFVAFASASDAVPSYLTWNRLFDWLGLMDELEKLLVGETALVGSLPKFPGTHAIDTPTLDSEGA